MFIRKYDLATFFKKQLKSVINVVYCIDRGIPIRTAFFCDVDVSIFPRTTIVSHPFGICISPNTIFGKRVDIRQGVTVGTRDPRIPAKDGAVIGDGVFLGANCTVLGAVRIGDGAVIGAHSLVLADVPSGGKVTGLWK